jgi:hypothetical protein
VSNDNPYSESLFKTLKYRPKYPLKPFDGVSEARDWVTGLVEWYNHEHRHSAIRFVTPAQRHEGLDEDLLNNRQAVYEAARVRNPKRWSGGVRNWQRIQEVHLNPDRGICAVPLSRITDGKGADISSKNIFWDDS